MPRIIPTLITGLVLILACTLGAFATDRLVPGTYASIEAAWAAASDGDTIKVDSGFVDIYGTGPVLSGKNNITLMSVDDTMNYSPGATVTCAINRGRIEISGFAGTLTVKGFETLYAGWVTSGIDTSSDTTFIDCTAQGTTDGIRGFDCGGVSTLTFENCTAADCDGAGFYVHGVSLAVLGDCVAKDCDGAGFAIERCKLAEIDHSAAIRCGTDNVLLLSGDDNEENVFAPPGLRAVITSFISVDSQGNNGIRVEGYHRATRTAAPGFDAYVDCVVRDSVICDNASGCGIRLVANADVAISYSDLWNNSAGDYVIDDPLTCAYTVGDGMIGAAPMFVGDPDYSLQVGSPCIGTGDPRDIDALETRADMGCIDYADAAYPAWLNRVIDGARIFTQTLDKLGHGEFSIPYYPSPTGSINPYGIFLVGGIPMVMNHHILMWDNFLKTYKLYSGDFQEIFPGQGYVYLNYLGAQANLDIEYTAVGFPPPAAISTPPEEVGVGTGRGLNMIGILNGQSLWQGDIVVKNNATGEIRTAVEDKAAYPDSWLNWNWVCWTGLTYDIIGLGNPNQTLEPWYCYRIWAYEPDLTLVFPHS